jgi:hypothetical protein
LGKGTDTLKHAVLLHTIQDAEHCLRQGFHREAMLFSANVHVVYYLRYQYGLECRDLCSCIRPGEIRQVQVETLEASNRLLDELDQQVAPEINRLLNLSMRYFTPLYSATAARQLSVYALLERCLDRLLAEYSFASVLVYDGVLGLFKSSIDGFLSRLFPKVRFRLVRYQHPIKADKTTISGLRLGDIPGFLLKQRDSKRFFRLKHSTQQGAAGTGMLVFEPLDRLRFLGQKFSEASLYSFDPWAAPVGGLFEYEISRRVLPMGDALESIRLASGDIQGLLPLLYDTFTTDFCRNFVQYLQIVNAYRHLAEEVPIRQVYWEVPPFQGAAALLLEYIMTSQAAQVTGVQSKATCFVGQTVSPYIPVTVFNRCRRFLTQGAAEKDIETIYPGITAKVEIGSPSSMAGSKTTFPSKNRKTADLAIYLTPSSSFLQTGQICTYATMQEALLKFLNEQQGKEIHIVTYAIPSDENCGMFSFLETLKNITLIHDATQESYLAKYAPKLVFMDTPSPYLKDVLVENVPVIILEDPTIVFDDKVLELLMKRVYYTRGLEDAERLLRQHFSGSLRRKNDAGYVKAFCIEPRDGEKA